MQQSWALHIKRGAAIVTALLGLSAAAFVLSYLMAHRAPDALVLADPALEAVGAQLNKVTITAWVPLAPGDDANAAAASLSAALGAVPSNGDVRVLAPGAGNERLAYRLPTQPEGSLTVTIHRAEPQTLSAMVELPAPAATWWLWRDRVAAALLPPRAPEPIWAALLAQRNASVGKHVFLGQQSMPRTYTVLEYDAPGKALWASRDRVARSLLRRLGAKTVEGVNEGDLYSVTAFTDQIPARLLVAGRAVNAAVALHWDDAHGQTRLWLGSPVINIEY